MTSKVTNIYELILINHSDMRRKGSFFYYTSFAHVISGFAFDRSGEGVYLWKYGLPICDRVEFLHLGFGDRLLGKHSYISFSDLSPGEIIREIEKRILPYSEFTRNLMDCNYFYQYLLTCHDGEDKYVRRSLSVLAAFLDLPEEFDQHLRWLLSNSERKCDDIFYHDIREIETAAAKGMDCLRAMLEHWELETIRHLGLRRQSL